MDRLYAVAMEPERFTELAEIWQERLKQAAADGQYDFDQQLRNLDAHLARADTLLSLVTTHQDLLPKPLNEKLQSESHAMIAIDEGGIIRGHNDAAIELYGSTENSPSSTLPFDEEALAAIRTKIAKLAKEQLPTETPSLLRGYHFDSGMPILMSFSTWNTPGGRNLLLLKTVDFSWPRKLTPLVKEAFGLTDAETAVLQLMAQGSIVTEIAELRDASIATVRTQVRSIYAKTSTRNQSEFMRMALGLTTLDLLDRHSITGAFQVPQDAAEPPYPRPVDRHLLALPDDRLLDYSIFGHPDGKPCLLMHSEFFGDGCSVEMVEYAKQKNIKIIAPARPHNGRSSPYPKSVKTYDQVNEDICFLLDHMGIDRVVVLSQPMAPSLFALMFGYTHPERVAGIVFLATLFPFGTEENEKKMLSFHRLLSSIIHRSPRLLEFIAKAGMAYHNRVGSRRFFGTFAEGRPADIKILGDDIAYGAMANGAQICGAKGHEGYYNDYRCVPEEIEGKFMSLEMPVTLVVGDTLPEKSNANLHSLVRRKKNFNAVPAVGGGQYTMYSHPKLIIKSVAEIWDTDI